MWQGESLSHGEGMDPEREGREEMMGSGSALVSVFPSFLHRVDPPRARVPFPAYFFLIKSNQTTGPVSVMLANELRSHEDT